MEALIYLRPVETSYREDLPHHLVPPSSKFQHYTWLVCPLSMQRSAAAIWVIQVCCVRRMNVYLSNVSPRLQLVVVTLLYFCILFVDSIRTFL